KNGASCHGSYNAQFSGQNLEQNGAAVGTANTVVNQASQAALQNATEIANGYHNCY
ncbi:filamentous hemagglutinin, partial [Fischerella major NIES-592]